MSEDQSRTAGLPVASIRMSIGSGPLVWLAERDESDALWVSTVEDGFDEAMIEDRFRLTSDGLVTDGGYFVVVELPSGYYGFALSFDLYEQDFPNLPVVDGMSVEVSEVTIDLQGRNQIWIAGAVVPGVNRTPGYRTMIEVDRGTGFARVRVVAVGRDQELAGPEYEPSSEPRAWYSIQVVSKTHYEPATPLAHYSD